CIAPPSTVSAWPVRNAEASEARNRTVPTRSSGTSGRGMHCIATMRCFCSGVTVLRWISVEIAPGRIALGDSVAAELARHRPGHADERGLGRDVVEVVWPPERHRARGHIDDAAPLRAPHCRQHCAAAQERACDIDLEHRLPFRERNLLEWSRVERRENRRVVDKNVDPQVSLLNDCANVSERSGMGDSGGDRACFSPGSRDLGRPRLAALTVALGNDCDRADRREPLSEGAPQALASAGDNRNAVAERRKNDIGSSPIDHRNLTPPAAWPQAPLARPRASTTTSIRDRARLCWP